MDYTINIPDDLIPGIIAAAALEGRSPEQMVNEYAVAAATKICQDLKVGPYFVGPITPRFNADGTPYIS